MGRYSGFRWARSSGGRGCPGAVYAVVVLALSGLIGVPAQAAGDLLDTEGYGLHSGVYIGGFYDQDPPPWRIPLGLEVAPSVRAQGYLFYLSGAAHLNYFGTSRHWSRYRKRRDDEGERICWSLDDDAVADPDNCDSPPTIEGSLSAEFGAHTHLIRLPVSAGVGFRAGYRAERGMGVQPYAAAYLGRTVGARLEVGEDYGVLSYFDWLGD